MRIRLQRCTLDGSGRNGRSRLDGGFTLMEMVIAVFVVSVMMAILTPHLLGIGKRAQATACEQNQRVIRAALEEYYMLYHAYPTGTTTDQLQTLVNAQILQSVPKEPGGGNYVIDDTEANNVVVSCDVHGQLGTDQ